MSVRRSPRPSPPASAVRYALSRSPPGSSWPSTTSNRRPGLHSEHLDFGSVGGAPLRSGFVQNIKAEGPRVYAHEIFVLNGARARRTYTVTRDFFFEDPECDGEIVFHSDVATLRTNASGNARGDVFVEPGEVEGLGGVHDVMWTVRDAAGAVAYRTACTAVTLD